MSVTRRRFLTIAAAFAATPALAQRQSWQGRAFGAEVAITLQGPQEVAQEAIAAARQVIAQMEQRFSLFRATSEIVALNRDGTLIPSEPFERLMQLADSAHRLTVGLFDPTVQPLWRAYAEGRDLDEARARVGWDRVRFQRGYVRLGTGQALTFNGIAQGFATDAVTELLAGRGFEAALVNIGEFRSLGGPWRLGISDPTHGLLATRSLETGAMATSSPMATPLDGGGHILHAKAAPRWSTVTVEADTAVMADALSTGLVLADKTLIRKVRQAEGVRRIVLIDTAGDLTSL
jgi:FAD:protein FMN transferase